MTGIIFIISSLGYGSVYAQGTNTPVITAPTNSQVLQGQVAITGSTDVPNFLSADVAFEYAADPTNTWFLIQSTSQPISNGTLGSWDTSSVTDGDYVIRLHVSLQDGTTQDATVAVRIRNYTIVPTSIPTVTATTPALEIPTAVLASPAVTPTPEVLPLLSIPSPLPPNPAGVTTNEIFGGFWNGALLIAGLFLLIGLIIYLRKRS